MSAPTWPDVLAPLMARVDLDSAAARWAMNEILSGAATPGQIAGFAVALRSKGETIEEIEGLLSSMYEHAVTIDVGGETLDVVGTGGDRALTVNISTMAALVAAAAGVRVIKHGNRAASSASGSADLLEALGVRLDLPPARVAELVDEVGITFCFAPAFHPAMRHAGPVRRELGVPTTFNILGPLANPGRPSVQAVGVADARMVPLVAGVLARRGIRALVFRGDDGLDELTTSTTSRVLVIEGGQISDEVLDPRALGVAAAPVEALRGADAVFNAKVCHEVLGGKPGPVRDAVILNAGAALAAVAGGERSLQDRVAAGMAVASAALDSGAAADVLRRWVAACG